MEFVLKVISVLGILWSAALIAFIIIYCIGMDIDIEWKFVLICVAEMVIWWRCFRLQRTAAVLGCGYCWWMAALPVGSWEWTTIWFATAALLSYATVEAWPRLRSGF